MKRFVLLMIGCALLASGCAKEIITVEEPVVPGHLIIDIDPTIDVPQTRDVKTGWENGDKIYVFFDIKKGVTTFDYITMTYNGTKWLFSYSSDTLEETLLSGSGGYVTALYFPYGTPTFTLSKKTATTSRLSFKFSFNPDSGGDYGIAYYCCPKANYTVADGYLKASLYMSLLPGDVQFFIPDIPEEKVDDFTFQCDRINRRQVGTLGLCLDFKWTTTEPEVTFTPKAGSAYAFKGYPYKGGMVFVGNLSSPGTSQDYEITVTDTKGTSETTDDVPYIFKVSGKTLNAHDAVRLPALTSSRWKKLVYGHDYVDFNLPSGNLWATENLGASKTYLQGGAFAWAATEEEEEYNFSWSTYPWIKSGYSSPYYITKYTFRDGEYDGIWYNSSHQFIGDDYKTLAHCNYEDDAARHLWGSPWHIPSPEAFQELVDNTNNYWVDDYEGYSGYKFESNKDASKFIFMPVTGIWSENGELIDKDWSGNYWTSSLYTDPYSEDEPESSMAAKCFNFNGANQTFIDYAYRRYGCAVRPVIGADELTVSVTGVSLNKTSLTLNEGDTYQLVATVRPSNASNKEVMWSSSSSAVWVVDDQGTLRAVKEGSATITVTTFDGKLTATCKVAVNSKPAINGHEYVDLGLPSGLKWATCNIGADSAKEYGDYFAWAETEPKDSYGWKTYLWMDHSVNSAAGITKYTYKGDGKTSLADYNYEDDAARQKWGSTWRIPSKEDFDELISNTDYVWMDDFLGVHGALFLSKANSNSIFLPAAGYRYGTTLYDAGSGGYYWSSSLDEYGSDSARLVYFNSEEVGRGFSIPCYGLAVRPVSD